MSGARHTGENYTVATQSSMPAQKTGRCRSALIAGKPPAILRKTHVRTNQREDENMAIKYKQKKFMREHTKCSQRTKDRRVKRYLNSERIGIRCAAFRGELEFARQRRAAAKP